MTRLSPTARASISTGHVLSVLGVDCFQLSMSAFVFPFPACGVLCMPILLYLLAERLVIILFGTLIIFNQGHVLTVAASFSSVYLIYMTDVTMAQMCWALRIRSQGRVAYVPQIASVHNMNVRDNILYGQPMEAKDYDRVLEACQLHEDISTFPAGDLTVVGEKGETLSGGQKQRISLARAAYNQADVYLLDDPLSALDVVVAKKVFKEVIGKEGILKKKTRIMACNQGSFLNHMDKLVLLHNGGASVYDTLVDLLKDNNAPETLRHESESMHRENRLIENTGHDVDLSGEGSNGRVIKDELPESTKSFWQLIRALARMSGPCIGVGFLACVVSAVALGWQLDWVRTWTRAEGSMVPMESQESPWIWALAAICATDVIARCLGSVLLAAAMRRLSSLLHNEMIRAILASPVTFFGSTPRGSIVNRFSVDLDYIDNRLYLTGKQCAQHTLFAVSRLVIIGTQSNVYRFVRLAAVFCGFVTLFCTMLFAVWLLPEDSAVDPSTIGLSLSAASLLIQTLAIACPMMYSCLHSMSGFERCIEYTELPQESEVEPGVKKYDFSVEFSDEWPKKGKVEFVSYSASYKPGILPDVLKDITFTVHPTEK
ncbi:multidrug resistance protein, putative, partial [Ixodes scapularis]